MSRSSKAGKEDFSKREIEILSLISAGLSNREISQKLYLSFETVKWYNKQLFSKLGASNRVQAINIAQDSHLIQPWSRLPVDEYSPKSGNLPIPINSYVRRENDIGDIVRLLNISRLIVLTGPGGVGKTRLALQVAHSLTEKFPQGVWFVDLAPLSNSDRVLEAIARVLHVMPGRAIPIIDALKHFLARQQILLILDNFEHVLDAAPMVTELLSAASNLTVFVTSREKLHVYGEVEYPVRPLRMPDSHKREEPQLLLAYESVDLFLQRAQAVQPDLQVLNRENLTAAARICSRLDGLPLAIELAASQVKYFSLPRLEQRLERSLGELPEGPRDLPARQRTLRATIEWSYNLLKTDEKNLLNRMSVFHAGCTFDAIQTVCSAGLSGNLVTQVQSLVDKNLLLVWEGPDDQPYFRMLETIREYAEEQLKTEGEVDRILKLYGQYYLNLSKQFSEEIRSQQHVVWNARMQAEEHNLLAALDWAFSGKDILLGLQLFTNLDQYWDIHGMQKDVCWFETALSHRHAAPLHLQASILLVAGLFYSRMVDIPRAVTLLQEAIELSHQLEDQHTAAWATLFLSANLSLTPEDARNCLQMVKPVLAYFRSCQDRPGIAISLTGLGESSRMIGEYEDALTYYSESLAVAEEMGDRFRQAINLSNMGFTAYHLRHYERSFEYAQKGLVIVKELAMLNISTYLYSLAGPIAALGSPEKAALLIGAAQANSEMSGADVQIPDRQDILPVIASTRQACGEDAYQNAWRAGYEMQIEDIYSMFLHESVP